MAKSVLTPPNDARTLVASPPVDAASGSYWVYMGNLGSREVANEYHAEEFRQR